MLDFSSRPIKYTRRPTYLLQQMSRLEPICSRDEIGRSCEATARVCVSCMHKEHVKETNGKERDEKEEKERERVGKRTAPAAALRDATRTG